MISWKLVPNTGEEFTKGFTTHISISEYNIENILDTKIKDINLPIISTVPIDSFSNLENNIYNSNTDVFIGCSIEVNDENYIKSINITYN